ncbi:MAG: hypothetical protein L3J39_13625 [Verrucomicrobiales bacterium]|nr:hypothetical protein [Verrucomicrobiales bacterium]
MKRLLVITILLSISVTSAQIRWDQLTKVTDSDSATPALEEWQQNVEAKYKQDGLIVPTFSTWFVITADSLNTLFPRHRFFAISWSEMPTPGKEKEAIGLAIDLEITLVCDAEGKIAKEVHHTGNYEAFGELLNAANVVIRSTDDAKLVWNAFCGIHQKHWQKQPPIKIDGKTWHLGDVTIGRFHYYYEVLLDADFRVASAKLHADEIKKP